MPLPLRRWRLAGPSRFAVNRDVVLRVASNVLRGNSPDAFERGQRKRTGDGIVTPAMVRRAIARESPQVESRP